MKRENNSKTSPKKKHKAKPASKKRTQKKTSPKKPLNVTNSPIKAVQTTPFFQKYIGFFSEGFKNDVYDGFMTGFNDSTVHDFSMY